MGINTHAVKEAANTGIIFHAWRGRGHIRRMPRKRDVNAVW
jgi:hypothetical protein